MFKQKIKLARNCKTKRSWLETVLSPWSEITKQLLRVRGSVWDSDSITAEPALSEEKIQKQVRSTQYQFRVFKNVDCFMSLRRRHLDKTVTWWFRLRNSTMLEGKCRLLPVPKHPHLRPAVTALDILSALILRTFGAKESVMTAKQTSRCAPTNVKDQAIDAVQA